MDHGPLTTDRSSSRFWSLVPSPWSIVLFLLLISQISFAKTPQTDWEFYQKDGHRSSTWDALVEAGFSAFDSNNFNVAMNFLERARALGCKDGLVIFKIANYKEMQGNPQKAICLLKEAEPLLRNRYAKNPATQSFAEHLGGLYYQTGQYELALPQYLEAIRFDGENFLRLYLVGQMYRMKKSSKEAIAYFEKAVKFDPPPTIPQIKILAQIELMKLYYDNKEEDKALQMVNLVLAQDPQNQTALSYQTNISARKTKAKEREILKNIIDRQ